MPAGVANPSQGHVSNTLPRPASSSSQGETFQNTGHSNQPAYNSRSSSQSSGPIELASATGITPSSLDARPPDVKQQPQHHSPSHLPAEPQIEKIGTYFITNTETNNEGSIRSMSMNIAEIHEAPQSRTNVHLHKALPSVQKTANDMYASPYKKRKPAPPPPPGKLYLHHRS